MLELRPTVWGGRGYGGYIVMGKNKIKIGCYQNIMRMIFMPRLYIGLENN